MSLIMSLVAGKPELESKIQGHDWAKRHYHEFLRYQSPSTGLSGTVTCDTSVGGVAMKKGDKVVIQYASVNRDEAKFAEGKCLRFDRTNSGQHMAFSFGIHRCIGSAFSELVTGIGLDEVTKRAKNFRLAAGADVVYTAGIARRPRELRLEFDLR
jgi:cytochrome P450